MKNENDVTLCTLGIGKKFSGILRRHAGSETRRQSGRSTFGGVTRPRLKSNQTLSYYDIMKDDDA